MKQVLFSLALLGMFAVPAAAQVQNPAQVTITLQGHVAPYLVITPSTQTLNFGGMGGANAIGTQDATSPAQFTFSSNIDCTMQASATKFVNATGDSLPVDLHVTVSALQGALTSMTQPLSDAVVNLDNAVANNGGNIFPVNGNLSNFVPGQYLVTVDGQVTRNGLADAAGDYSSTITASVVALQ